MRTVEIKRRKVSMARSKKKAQPEVADRLEKLIQFSGITRKDFAALMGKTSRTVYSWLHKKTFIHTSVIFEVAEKIATYNVACSKSWLLSGDGAPPSWLRRDAQTSQDYIKFNAFSKFKLDYNYATLSEFFKRSYPDCLSLLIADESYAPRIQAQTLLIAVSLDKSKYKENWGAGYLLKRPGQCILPVDIYAEKSNLYARAFSRDGFEAIDIDMEDQAHIFPIINTRILY